MDKYGDAWKSTEWLVTIKSHRPATKGQIEEWYFDFEEGEDAGTEYAITRTWMTKFLDEGRLTGKYICHACLCIFFILPTCLCVF
jgi:hypothetical protein